MIPAVELFPHAALVLLDELADPRLHGVEDAGQVDVDGLVPRVVGHELDGQRRIGPCVGQDDVEPAELLDPGPDRRLERRQVAHVGLFGVHRSARRLDQAHGHGQVLGRGERVRRVVHVVAQVDADDAGALLREADGVVASLPPSDPGDEDDLPLEAAVAVGAGAGHGADPTVGRPAAEAATPLSVRA